MVDGRRYETDYSQRIVELIVERKGVRRMPRYLGYRRERGGKLAPLFRPFEQSGQTISVLEPGCSSGHLSETILGFSCVERLVSSDVDAGMLAVAREKKEYFGYGHWEIHEAPTPEFTREQFDVVLLSAMLEHVDRAVRPELIRACWERVKPGGLFAVLETENRWWPWEYHVLRLPIPYAHYLPPRLIYRLLRWTGRYDAGWSYKEFANPNTGWWGVSPHELLPVGARAEDVSDGFGFGARRYRDLWRGQGFVGGLKRAFFAATTIKARLLGLPAWGLLPALYVVYRKKIVRFRVDRARPAVLIAKDH
ncbi:MAG: methyltransferase domain-containing protein [Deltaproteobacteria bacterium]|nr:methyltransferase domain-containing protein [Deltaproteobacteria bacterium]